MLVTVTLIEAEHVRLRSEYSDKQISEMITMVAASHGVTATKTSLKSFGKSSGFAKIEWRSYRANTDRETI